MKPYTNHIETACDWLHNIITGCLKVHFGKAKNIEIGPIDVHSEDSSLSKFIAVYQPTREEFVILILALIPHLKPDFLSNPASLYSSSRLSISCVLALLKKQTSRHRINKIVYQ